jgi:hypothetical protein
MIPAPVKQLLPRRHLTVLLSSTIFPPAIQPWEQAVISRYEPHLPTLDGSGGSGCTLSADLGTAPLREPQPKLASQAARIVATTLIGRAPQKETSNDARQAVDRG